MRKRRILLVGMANSIHLARWALTVPKEYELEVLDSLNTIRPHALLEQAGIKVHFILGNSQWIKGRSHTIVKGFHYLRRLVEELTGGKLLQRKVEKLIRKWRPGIVHSMETQSAGYLIDSVFEDWRGEKPAWIHTTWGSDLYLFGKLPEHSEKVGSVVTHCDRLIVDCERDIELVSRFGRDQDSVVVIPMCIGLDTGKLYEAGEKGTRSIILVKGYQSWAGRALTALRGMERCEKAIRERGLKVVVFGVSTEDVKIKASLMREAGFPLEIREHGIGEEALFDLFKTSLIYVGLGISDGTPISLIEAMAAGAFPIQSEGSAADEWIEHGKTGWIVNGEDSDEVADAVETILDSDDLIDTARVKNRKVIGDRLQPEAFENVIEDLYNMPGLN